MVLAGRHSRTRAKRRASPGGTPPVFFLRAALPGIFSAWQRGRCRWPPLLSALFLNRAPGRHHHSAKGIHLSLPVSIAGLVRQAPAGTSSAHPESDVEAGSPAHAWGIPVGQIARPHRPPGWRRRGPLETSGEHRRGPAPSGAAPRRRLAAPNFASACGRASGASRHPTLRSLRADHTPGHHHEQARIRCPPELAALMAPVADVQ